MISWSAHRGALCLLILFVAVAGARGEHIVGLDTRPGVKQYYLLLDDPGETYKAAVIFFPGYRQELYLASQGTAQFKGNMYADSWRGSKTPIVVAIVDAPTDMEEGFTQEFREDPRHMVDVLAIIRDLKARFPGIKIYLIGSSNGTVSAAYAGSRLGSQLSGVVLMSSVLSLDGFDFSSIKVPLLFVHHVDDECGSTPYENAKWLSRNYPLISVRGGFPPESGPCGSRSAHTFFGRGKGVASAIADWMFRFPFPRDIR